MSNIKDANLWQSGKDKIDWVRSYMPLLSTIEEEFKANQPFAGILRQKPQIWQRFCARAVPT